MSSRISGNSLFAQATSGLQSSYYYLLSLQDEGTTGLTLENILNSSTSTTSALYSNYSFAKYLTTNFSSIDSDGDGEISESDLSSYTSKLYSQGLTYNQLASLCSSGSSSTLLETVLNNFSEIDANGDGRVTSAEISAYGIDQEKEEMQEKYPTYDLNAMSIFYDTSSTTSSYETTTEDTSV